MSPRPRRHWCRPRNVAVMCILLLLSVLGFMIVGALTARPGQPIDFAGRLTQLKGVPQEPAPGGQSGDAQALLLEALALAGEAEMQLVRGSATPTSLDYTILYGPVSYGTPGYGGQAQADMRKLAREALRALDERGVPEVLDELARTPESAGMRRQDGPVVLWLLPHLGTSRRLARANAAALREAAHRGDGAEVARRYEHLLAMGRTHTHQPIIIERLVGIAIMALAHNQLSEVLTVQTLDEAALRSCLEALDRQLSWCAPASLPLEGERLSLLDSIQRVYTDNGSGGGRFVPTAYHALAGQWGGGSLSDDSESAGFFALLGRISHFRIANLAGIAFPGKETITRQACLHIESAITALRSEPGERERLATELDARLTELGPKYALLRELLPALGRYVKSEMQHQMATEAMRIHLALEIYRARHGRYPEHLSALSPEILPSIPRDARCDATFGYRLLAPGEDPRGRGFLLYSFGSDRQDDGGTPAGGSNPFVAFQPHGAGLDFVFNIPPTTQEELDANDAELGIQPQP